MNLDYSTSKALIWQGKKLGFRVVKRVDQTTLADLIDIDEEKELLLENTKRFLEGKKANHALLWGAMGSGKSSLIKAVFNELKNNGLRLIELDSSRLRDLPLIAQMVENEPYKFVVFCDDLSFEENDKNYKGLKRIMEGSIELPPENLLVYATSNRRHLLPEYKHENTQTLVDTTEIHYSDAVEEKLSLADRFGLKISFYKLGMEHYLKIIERYFEDKEIDKSKLIREARLFASLRASHTGRTAKQFIASFDKF